MEQTITVSQLAWYIKKIFEAEELLYNISVVGEVSGLKIVRGIAYFDLKDASSLISCVSFDGYLLENVRNGDKIVATGTPGFYVKGGKLNFNVSKIKPFGVGELFQAFMDLKNKLYNEGLFDESFKKPVPQNASKIAVITSETGAVLHDIINVATRRNPAINIVLYPAKVQGEGSAESIIKALDFFEEKGGIDAVIIARGGGSMEDLWEFNSEALARRIFDFPLPVVSAVGHETDFTICDFVADKRAPTPSAAAELVVENKAEKIHGFERQVMILKSRLENIIIEEENLVCQSAQTLSYLIESKVKSLGHSLELATEKLEKFNPNKILAMGYAKIEGDNGVITSINQTESGDKVKIHLKDGFVTGEIL
jgi:exodeoxyribonuclease VII large subunit